MGQEVVLARGVLKAKPIHHERASFHPFDLLVLRGHETAVPLCVSGEIDSPARGHAGGSTLLSASLPIRVRSVPTQLCLRVI